jgi:type II secretory pathway pseudopilin PulG
MRPINAGFTLTELLVAAAASFILSGVALGGLVTFQQMSQQTDERLVQQAELQRALHLMSTDIQEGQRIQSGAPPLSGYTALFQSIRSDGSTISYYSAVRGTRVWSGPHILYRWDYPQDKRPYALIDQLAIVDGVTVKPSDVCTGSGTLVSGPAGVVVWIEDQSKAKICLMGHLAKSKEGIKASVVATTRVAP